ncbi:MAG: LamG domain-containing protein [Polyangiaceae bacterium]|nr:LamG domain-containing protein [Polyangiaceae bacterium]
MTLRPLFGWVLLLVSVALPGCSDDTRERRGQLMLVLVTDMQPPKDFDHVTVEVSSFGSVQFRHEYTVGEGNLTLPATLGIVAGKDPTEPVTIRVSSSLKHKPRTLREVVTPIPADRVATLTIPIEWLCVDQAKTDDDGSVVSTCDNGETCIAGGCESSAIDVDDLPDYDASAIFGGGDGTGTGSCFDTLECFESGAAVEIDQESCSISELSQAQIREVNLALVLEPETQGICGPRVCLVPLDRGGLSGWAARDGVIELPAAVCERLASGAALGVAATTVCDQKTASLPTCGAWSSIDEEGTRVAEAPQGPWASAGGAGGQGGAEAGASASGAVRAHAGGDEAGGAQGTAGADEGTAGADEGTGGTDEGTGGTDEGTGGAEAGTGGTDEGTGGANGGMAGAGAGRGGADGGMAGAGAGQAGAGEGQAGTAGSAGQPASPGLLTYYRFDEDDAAQLYADATGHGYDLIRGETTDTSVGDAGPLDSHDPAVATTRVNGQGYAAEFDGLDDYAWRSVSGPFLSRALTVSASVRSESSTYLEEPLVSTQAACPGGGYALSVRRDSSSGVPEYVFCYRYGGDCSTHELGWQDTTLSSQNEGWRAVTATYEEISASQARVRLFVDGAQVAESTFPDLIDLAGVLELLVGTHRDLLDDEPNARYVYSYFGGTLDEVQIHDRALSPDDVGQAYAETHYSTGPNGYRWRAFDEAGSQTSWLTTPSTESASVEVTHAASSRGGLAARLAEPGALVDLSAYDEAVIDADIAAGALFAVSLERSDSRCVWARQVGQGPTSYVIDLGAPSYCESADTAECGFDFGVDQLSITTDSSEPNPLGITVSGLSFRTTGSGVGARGPVGGALGPEDLCWQLTTFGAGATAAWYVPLSTSEASAMLSGDVDTEAYLQADARGLYTSGTYLEIDADLSAEAPHRLRLEDTHGSSCYWDRDGLGTGTHLFALDEPDECSDDGGTFDIWRLSTIALGKGPDNWDPVWVSITGLRFVE